jgi:hypothetical protein
MSVKGTEGQGTVIDQSNVGNRSYVTDNPLFFSNITSAYRVVDIVLDANHKLFEKAGR